MTLEQERALMGPMLSDGSTFTDLIDVGNREVSMRLLSDPEIYRLELKHLFARTWSILAHEDEIPRPGDYVTRYVGQDEVIVSRGRDGKVNVSLNVCTHRGTKVCRFESGNAAQFQCPYHGWLFEADGSFLGAPVGRERMHGEIRSKEELRLRRARVDVYAGMIFATFDDSAPSLREYLGPITWYWDMMFDRTNKGMTVLGAPQRFTIKANWKCAGEQFAGDIFHTMSLHRSMQDLGLVTTQEPAMAGVSAAYRGHFVRCFDYAEGHYITAIDDTGPAQLSVADRLRKLPPPGLTTELVEEVLERMDEGQLRTLAHFTPQVGCLFPNVGGLAMPMAMPDGSVSAFFTWRAWIPKGPDSFELIHWTVVDRDLPQDFRDSINVMTGATFGVSGFVEMDDTDTWPMQTKIAKGVIGQQQKLRYQAILGQQRPADWPGPTDVEVYGGFPKDDTQWNFWVRYLEFMQGNPW